MKVYSNRKKHKLLINAESNWSSINWNTIENSVSKLKQRIFLAKLHKFDGKKLRKLQSIMIGSKANLLYSIRRVTSSNRGKKTAGIDKMVYLTPEARWNLYLKLSLVKVLDWIPSPVRRVEIPRPGKTPRPLGIPNITDRIIQLIIKNALEPEWEAIFENSSVGFRPAKSCHDAMSRIWRIAANKNRIWVLDADIKGCFDNIAHEPLIKNLDDFPAKNLIFRWLKAGYYKDDKFTPTELGTPQGGMISPLLANIALHGMEAALKIKYHKQGFIRSECKFYLVRYADDFVIFTKTAEYANEAREILTPWLADRGMQFSPEKTSIKNLFNGLDFLGWTFRIFYNFKNSKDYKRAKGTHVSLVKPSTKSVQSLKDELKLTFRKLIGKPVYILISHVNKKITGWSNYHKYANSNETFRSMDHFLYQQTVRYIRRKHPNKSWAWLLKRYFTKTTVNRARKTGKMSTVTSNWTFSDRQIELKKFKETSLENYISTRHGTNPLNPLDRDYFLKRKTKQVLGSNSFKNKLMEKQKGLCPICGSDIIAADWDEPLHVHHLIPRIKGGTNEIGNLMLLHEECHYNAHKSQLDKATIIELLNKAISDNSIK